MTTLSKIRLTMAGLFLAGAGMGTQVDWYHEGSDHAAYLTVGRTTLAAEWTPPARVLPYVWACDPKGAWSLGCPTDQGESWEPVTPDLAASLATVSDRADWSGCLVHWGDTTVVRCPDGYTLES